MTLIDETCTISQRYCLHQSAANIITRRPPRPISCPEDRRLIVTTNIVVKRWPLTICVWNAQCYRNVVINTTVYPKKYAHGFVVLCFVVVMQSFIMNSHEVFIHIHQGCFAGTGAIVRLPQCQWSKPDGYGKISQCITTTKHSKAKTVCILLGINCTLLTHWIFTSETIPGTCIVEFLQEARSFYLIWMIRPSIEFLTWIIPEPIQFNFN